MLKLAKHICIIVISAVLISCSSPVDEKIETARTMFADAVALPHVPGLNVAVADASGVIWAEGFGYANLEYKIPMSPKIKMRIGSVAKVLTTAALMKMVERGELDLDVDIRTYVPEWPQHHASITLRQLAAHTAGVRHYKGYEFILNRPYESSVHALNIFKDDPLKFDPGSDYSYSTYGWTLIAAAMENVSAKPFKNIIETEILVPFALNDTTFDDRAPIIENRQSSYQYSDGKLLNTREVDSSYKYAGGGFLSTPTDVANFALSHSKEDNLLKSTLNEMFEKLPPSPHGIGWVVGFERYENNFTNGAADDSDILRMMNEHPNTVMHSGGSMGGQTMMMLCLDHNRAVALTKNVSNGPAEGPDPSNHFLLALKTLDIFHGSQ